MTTVLFFALAVGFAWLVWRAGHETRVKPQSQPGTIVRLVIDEDTVVMNVHACICSCDDWQKNRYSFQANTPMRLCRHLVSYVVRHEDCLPAPVRVYLAVIQVRAGLGFGLPCGPGTEYGSLEGTPYVLYARASTWPHVQLLLGHRTFSYDIQNTAWEGDVPPQHGHFARRAQQLANMVR